MRTGVAVAVVVAAVFGFAAGAVLGSQGTFGIRVGTSVGDAVVGEHVVTISANGRSYGATGSVSWRDSSGTSYLDGWPACLSAPGEVKGLRFVGTTVWNGEIGADTDLWVDCEGGS